MEIWQTFGHNQVKSILEQQLASGKLPHAYLFSGPEGLGKKTLALEFAKRILGTERLENHPDFQILDVEGEITAELLINFISSLGFKPFVAKKKVAIINNAQNLNQTSANALLKTLEEPSPSTVIILVASGGRLLKTIVSRCQPLYFNVFSQSLLKEFARTKGFADNAEILDLAFGSSARLVKLAEDKNYLEQQKDLAGRFIKLKTLPLAEKLLAISRLAESETSGLREDLVSWMLLQAKDLKQSPQDFGKARALMEAAEALDRNLNKKLVLQGLMMKI